MFVLFLAPTLAATQEATAARSAHAPAWQPARGTITLPLWPGIPPDGRTSEGQPRNPAHGPEVNTTRPGDQLIAGRPVIRLGNVSHPTLTLYPAKSNNSRAAVLVFPGGAYKILAIDLEGTEVCTWLNSIGVNCILVKYRVPNSGPYPDSAAALQDAQRAMGLVRAHAEQWKIDPDRVGVLGFSAGGHLAAAISTHHTERAYPPVDAADKLSCKPDFAVILYPGYLAIAESHFAFNPNLPVNSRTPPTYLLQTEDDHVAHVESSIAYFMALKKADVPAELHIYTSGVHGYGLRRTALPVTRWPRSVARWFSTIGILPAS
jgi:acetyl esterase/lipase